MPGRPWTQDDDERLLKELLAGVPIEKVATNLERSRSAILSRAWAHRISLRSGRPVQRKMDHLLTRQLDLPRLKARK